MPFRILCKNILGSEFSSCFAGHRREKSCSRFWQEAQDSKEKEKKDPNEPEAKATVLFFRDTQAAIKGQNPNATFGEVSKIVGIYVGQPRGRTKAGEFRQRPISAI